MSSVSEKLKSWKVRGLLVFCVLIIAFVSLLPIGVRVYVTSWLKNNGADTADIHDIDINLFTGTLRLKGVDIKKDGKVVFGDSDIMVDIGIKNLMKKDILLEGASLSDVVLDIEQSLKGDLRIASYSSKPSTKTQPKEPSSTSSAWTFTAKKVTLDNVAIRYAMPDLTINAAIEHMVLERFSTGEGPFNGRLELVGRVNDSPVKVTLDKLDVRNGLDFSGNISVTEFLFKNLAPLLKRVADIEHFTGAAGIDGKVDFHLDADGNISADYDGLIKIEALNLVQQDTAVSGTVQWQGKSNVQLKNGKTVVELQGNLALNDLQTALAGDMKIAAQSATFAATNADLTLDSSSSSRLSTSYDGVIELGGFDFSQPGTHLSTIVKWQGKADVQQEAGTTAVGLDGTIDLDDTRAELADEITLALKSAAVTAAADLEIASVLKYGGKVQADIDRFGMNKGQEPWAAFETLALAGKKSIGESPILLENIALKALAMPPSALQPYAIGVEKLSVPVVETTGDFTSYRISSPVITAVNVVQEPQLQVDIASISTPAIEIRSTNNVTASSLSLDGLKIVSSTSQNANVDLKKLTVSDFSFGPESGTVIDAIVFDALKADITVPKFAKAEGKSEPVAEPAADGNVEESSGSVPLKINSVTISKDSVVSYRDETLSQPFAVKTMVDEFKVTDIDLENSEKPIRYLVKLIVDDYGQLKVDGQAVMLPDFTLRQKLSLKNYPAVNVSPFLESAMGNRIESGRLQFTSDLSITGAKLQSDNRVTLNEFETKIGNSDQADEFSSNLPLPLGTALYLLRDDKDNISLSIPINGEFGKMKVGLQDILVTAISKSLTVAVTPYLAYTFLGPTGALVYLGAQVGKNLLATELPVIEFEPGQTAIPEDQLEMLNEVGASLQESFAQKAEDTISICAKVRQDEAGDGADGSLSDNDMRKKLFALGDERSNAVRTYLIETYSLDGERLISCSPGLLFEKSKKPYVQFMQ